MARILEYAWVVETYQGAGCLRDARDIGNVCEARLRVKTDQGPGSVASIEPVDDHQLSVTLTGSSARGTLTTHDVVLAIRAVALVRVVVASSKENEKNQAPAKARVTGVLGRSMPVRPRSLTYDTRRAESALIHAILHGASLKPCASTLSSFITCSTKLGHAPCHPHCL